MDALNNLVAVQAMLEQESLNSTGRPSPYGMGEVIASAAKATARENKHNRRKHIFHGRTICSQGTYHCEFKIQPNSLCPCGSGKKYKNCCG